MMNSLEETKIKLSDFRLLVFDIDGTLILHGEELKPFTRNTLFRLRENGFDFTLATGKSLPATKDLADELEIDLPLILGNGTLIQTRQGETLARTSLPLEVTQDVIDSCLKINQDLVLYIDDGLYVKKLTDNMLPIYGVVRSGLFQVGEWENLGNKTALTNKCVAVETRTPDKLMVLSKVFSSIARERADVIRTCEELLEVVPKNVDKASGLRALCEHIGISMKHVMAFGDFDNDASMLAAAGLGVAVSGASPSAMQNADILVETCEQQGPAKFLAGLMDDCSLCLPFQDQ